MHSSGLRTVAAVVALLSALGALASLADGHETRTLDAVRLAGSPAPSCAVVPFTRTRGRRVLQVAQARMLATDRALRPGQFPSVTDQAGRWRTVPAETWSSGFFAGSLWLAYRHTRRPAFEARARAWTHPLADRATDTSTHDIGFQIMSSFGDGYALTHDPRYKAVILRAAASLATRYDADVGAIRSWGPRSGRHHFKVIVDNLMNLRLLFWASAHGGPRAWRHLATRHALTTAQHFVRRDGSTVHLVDFDPRTGRVQGTANPQGFDRSSTWSRGQAWAVSGFSQAFEQTGDTRFLAAARRTADYFIGGLPGDCVPYWDFDAPGIPDAPKDSSAAAIAAAGLLRLSRLEPSASRRTRDAQYASGILSSLADHYVADSGQATLTGSTSTLGVDPPDIGTSWGDYYLVQAVESWLRAHRP